MVVIKIEEQERIRTESLPYKLPKKLREILEFFKFAVHNKNTSAVFIFDGRSGMGKTTLAGQVGLYCDPNFSLKNFYFTPNSFIEGLEKAKKGDFLLFDEAMLISSRNALSEINKMIIIAMSMIRSKQIFVGFGVNSIFDLDRNLALSRADLLLNVYGQTLIDRGTFMTFFKAEDGRDRIKELYLRGKKYYSYSEPKANFNSIFPAYFVVDNNEYEKKKQQGVKEFLMTSRGKWGVKDKEARDNLIFWVKDNYNISNKKISEITELSFKTIYNILEAREKK